MYLIGCLLSKILILKSLTNQTVRKSRPSDLLINNVSSISVTGLPYYNGIRNYAGSLVVVLFIVIGIVDYSGLVGPEG